MLIYFDFFLVAVFFLVEVFFADLLVDVLAFFFAAAIVSCR